MVYMKIATKFIISLLASTGLAYAGELIPIGALEEFTEARTPEYFDRVLQQEDRSYVAFGLAYSSDYSARVYWSPDGQTWSLQHTVAQTTLRAMATGGGRTIVIGDAGKASVSSDGKTWSAISAPAGTRMVAAAYLDGAFYTLNILSNDATELWRWTAAVGWAKMSGLPAKANYLATGLGKWFAWGGPALHVSVDGITWTTKTFSSPVSDVDVGDGKVLVTTQWGSEISSDAKNWNPGPFRDGGSVVFTGGRFVNERGLATGMEGEPLLEFQPNSGLIHAASHSGLIYGAYYRHNWDYVRISRPVEAAPNITFEESEVSVSPGTVAIFRVRASGGQLDYQWYQGQSGDTSQPVIGARSSIYRLPPGLIGEGGHWCRISNSLGFVNSITTRGRATTDATGSLVYEVSPRTQSDVVTVASTTDWNAQGLPSTSYRWTRNGLGVPAGKSPQLIRVGPTFDDAGYYKVNVFYDGRTYTSDPVPVGVVRRTVTIGGLTGEGKSIRLRQMAAGPDLTYFWRREGVDLVDDPGHIDGATTASLSLNNIRPEDEGWYTCYVANGQYSDPSTAEPFMAGMSYYLTVEPIPVIESIEAPAEGMVARSMRIQAQSRQVVLRYEVRGLPAGMTFDSKSGTIAGAPLASGIHRIGIRAINSAGASPWQTITITIAPMPDHLTGSFQGLMGRMVSTGEGLGGACSIKVSRTGAVTGFVDIGSKRYPYTGRLDCTGSTPTCFTTKCAGGQVVVQFSYQAFSDSMVGSVGALDGSWSTPLLAKKVGLSSQSAAWMGTRYVDLTPLTVSEDRPQGIGTGTINIGKLGNFSWVGKLADGSAYSCAGYLTPDGHFAARNLLYGGKGSLQGWQHVDASKDKPYGTLEWMKNPVPNAKSFPQGFARHSLSVTPKP